MITKGIRAVATRGSTKSRATGRDQSGVTLIELSIGMTILSVIVLICFDAVSLFLSSAQSAVNTAQATQKEATLLSEMRTQIISANIIFDPSQEGSNAGPLCTSIGTSTTPCVPVSSSGTGGFSLRIYTQLNGVFQCVQWRELNNGHFQTREYSSNWQVNNQVSSWTDLSGGLDNPTSEPPFALNANANFGGISSSRLLDVTLMYSTVRGAQPAVFATSIAARDAEYYPPNTGFCSPVPSP